MSEKTVADPSATRAQRRAAHGALSARNKILAARVYVAASQKTGDTVPEPVRQLARKAADATD